MKKLLILLVLLTIAFTGYAEEILTWTVSDDTYTRALAVANSDDKNVQLGIELPIVAETDEGKVAGLVAQIMSKVIFDIEDQNIDAEKAIEAQAEKDAKVELDISKIKKDKVIVNIYE